MDRLKGFTYIFEDKKWFNKMFVGSLITAIPIVETVSNGYQMQVIENLKAGNPQPLPEWNNMNKMFDKGLKLWFAVNLFYIPSIVISVISWLLGIPLLLGFIGSFIASLTTGEYLEGKGIFYVLRYILFPLIEFIIAGIAVFLGSIALPVVFFFVPAMALRCQETGSLASTLNIFAHIKFVLRNVGDYVISRISILGMLLGMELIASMLGGLTVWILGLGFLIGWFLVAAGRFWSRLAWAYFLVEMRRKEYPQIGDFPMNQINQNQSLGMQFNSVRTLT